MVKIKPKVSYQTLFDISYEDAWNYQKKLHKELVDLKLANRKKEDALKEARQHHLIFCEHNHVYTVGKSGSDNHLLLNQTGLQQKSIEFFKINRGGDITYHGPGQITGYPIFDLDDFFYDVHKYVRFLEEAVIRTLTHYGIKGERIEGYTGVWIRSENPLLPHRKICAIGVHLSRWVTMHGFALNVNTDLRYFQYIIPCGIVDKNKTITSLSKELGKEMNMDEVREILKNNFAEVFEFEFVI